MSVRKLLLILLVIVVVLTVVEKCVRIFFPAEADATRGGIDQTFSGVGAFVELMWASNLDVHVSYAPPASMPAQAQVAWFIAPTNLFPADGEALAAWIERGGTAIFTLPGSSPSVPVRGFFDAIELPTDDATWAHYLYTGKFTGEIQIRATLDERKTHDIWLDLPEIAEGWVPVLEIDDSPLVWEKEMGGGKAVLVNSSRLFENLSMHMAGNAVVAYDIARHYQGDLRRLDINRYGNIPHQQGSLWQLILMPPFRHVTVFATLLVVLAIWSKWWSPRPAREPPPQLRRARSEYVEALAQLAGGTHNRAAVLELYRSHVASLLHAGRETHSTDEAVLSDRARRVFGLSDEDIELILHPITRPSLSDSELLEHATRLEVVSRRLSQQLALSGQLSSRKTT